MIPYVAIDPGSSYTGVAEFEDGAPTKTYTLSFEEVGEQIEKLIQTGHRAVVYEEWRLFPWLDQEQAFNELQVVQVIGILRYVAQIWNVPTIKTKPLWKRPTQRRLDMRGVDLIGKNRHEQDAELAGWAAQGRGLLHRHGLC